MPKDSKDSDDRLGTVLAHYLHAVERGEPLNEDEFISAHGDLADDLRSFFRNRKAVERMTAPLASEIFQGAATIGLDEPVVGSFCVRYFGDYELVDELGRGGMGVVYRARQVSLNRSVALKMILSAQLASASDVARFRGEAEAVANLDHPNIAPIYEIGEHEGQHYFSMKLIAGESLSAALPRLRTDLESGVALLSRVARAIHHAHQRGVLHRDLKPANVLLGEEGEPYITDFGLAKRVESDSNLTGTGAIVGTPSYMAPEQADGEKNLSTAVDVYSLGAILYELLTGQPPFRADSPIATLLQVTTQAPVCPRAIDPTIDRDLETICLKCLEKSTGGRYDSAAALAEELERWLRREPILARPAGKAERAWRWCRRNPVTSGLIGAVAASMLIGTTVSVYFAAQAVERANEVAAQRDRAENEASRAVTARIEATSQLNRAEWMLYGKQINGALREWDTYDVVKAWGNLNATRADFRGWEFDYAHTLFRRNQHAHDNKLGYWARVAASENSEFVVSHSPDGDLCVWDASMTERKAKTNIGGEIIHNGSIAVNHDGSIAAVCTDDSTITLWDMRSGTAIRVFSETGPDSKGEPLYDLAFSSDDKFLAGASPDQIACIWETATGRKVRTLRGHSSDVWKSGFSPDGKLIFTGSLDGTAKMWNAASGTERLVLPGHLHGVFAFSFSPDGALVATGDDKDVRVWRTGSGELKWTFSGHTDCVRSLAFSRDGKRLVSGSADESIRTWNVDSGEPLFAYRGHSSDVLQVSFVKDSLHVLSASEDGVVKTWDVATAQDDSKFKQAVAAPNCLAIDSHRIVTSGPSDSMVIWDAANGREISRLPAPQSEPWSLEASRDGKCYVANVRGTVLEIRDMQAGAVMFRLDGRTDYRNVIRISPNGAMLAANVHGEFVVWDIRTGKEQYTRNADSFVVRDIAFSPDSKLLATTGDDGIVKFWDTATGEGRSTLPALGMGEVSTIAFSPDGSRLAGGGIGEALRIWNVADGKLVQTIEVHTGGFYCLAFSPDGTRLAAAGRELLLLNTATGEETLSLAIFNKVFNVANDIAFSSDGLNLFCRSQNGKLVVLETAPRPTTK